MARPERFIKKALVEKIADAVSRSISKSSEEAYMACGNGKTSILGTGNNESVDADVSEKGSEDLCGKKGSILFHTHGLGSGIPSSSDIVSNKHIFGSIGNVKASCSAGLDGIHCVGRDGERFSKGFTKVQEEMIVSSSGIKTWNGDSIFCDKVQKEPNEKYLCISQKEKNKEDQDIMGVFDEVSMVGGIANAGLKDADIAMFSDKDDRSIKCFGTTSGRKNLACILGRPR